MAVKINKKDDLPSLKKKVSKQRKKVKGEAKKTEAGRPSTVDESEAILNSLVAGGDLVSQDEAADLEAWTRREQVWRLHLKGVNKTVIAKFFGVSETTIYKDVKKYNESVQDQLSHMGPAGVIVESYAYYEQLRGEVMRLIDLLDDNMPNEATIADITNVIRDKLPLMRLAKEVEDSKMRMLMGIGLVPKMKDRTPVPALDADHVEAGQEAYTTDQAKQVLDELLEMVGGNTEE